MRLYVIVRGFDDETSHKKHWQELAWAKYELVNEVKLEARYEPRNLRQFSPLIKEGPGATPKHYDKLFLIACFLGCYAQE